MCIGIIRNGGIVAECPNPAVPSSVIQDINEWLLQGATMEDVVDYLRTLTVPIGYDFHTWKPGNITSMHHACTVYYYIRIFMLAGMSEDMTHKLRSILAQYEYVYQVCKWHDEGVLFRSHIYVPELHPITKFTYCEREDEAHVLKVCIHMM